MGTIDSSNGTIRVSGDLTFDSVPGMVAKTPKFTDGGKIIVDLSGVEKADSAGLALLLGWIRNSRNAGSELHFSNVPAQIQSLVRVAGLESLLRVPAS